MSANLDVSEESNLEALRAQGRIARSAVLQRGGRAIGWVGVTTPRVSFISSPRQVVVDPNVVAAVQAEVNRLSSQGVGIVILLSHLETLAENQSLLAGVRGVDLVVAATPFEILANAGTLLVPGDEENVVGGYPTFYPDAAQTRVPVVSTGGSTWAA